MENLQRRLLIVDDNRDFAEALRRTVVEFGWKAEVLTSDHRFETTLANWNPQIIVLDIVMPGRDGLELIGVLARENFQGGIILISGALELYLTMSVASAKARGLKICAALHKPFRMTDLKDLLRDVENEMCCRPQ